MRSLWPPIEVIARNLQGGTNEPLHFPGKEEAAEEFGDAKNTEMPAFIRDKIRQRIASRDAKFDTQPKAGQIWRFDDDQENLAPLCVLLDRPQDEHRWLGWLAAPEADYATNQDVLLEPQDEPFDPLAGMVQTWNPVKVDMRKGSAVLAQLATHRLDAIREMAAGKCEEGGGARPGFVAPLRTYSGATVLAGTRITHPDDPRRRYQALYRVASQALEQHSSATVIHLPDRQRLWRNVGWSLAASLMLAQTAIIASLMRGQPDKSIEEQVNGTSEYRSVPQPAANYAYLEVVFKPDAREVDIRKLLTRLNATIVDGPGEFGQYRAQVKAGAEQEAASIIQGSGLADSVRAR
jgi:hypothetical protein